MITRSWFVGVIALAAAGVGVWRFTQPTDAAQAVAKAGTLTLRWRGSLRGAATLPAKVNWCPVSRTAVLEAVSGDTGVAVVIYEQNALTKGPHTAVTPGVAVVPPRPGASVAMRWPVDTVALAAFTSETGQVDLRPSAEGLSGTLTLRMRATSGSDSLTVIGNFSTLPVSAMAVGCQ